LAALSHTDTSSLLSVSAIAKTGHVLLLDRLHKTHCSSFYWLQEKR